MSREEGLEEALKGALASLVAAISILRRSEEMNVKPSRSVASNAMFSQMLRDYEKSVDDGREAIL